MARPLSMPQLGRAILPDLRQCCFDLSSNRKFPSAGNSELRHHAEVAGLAVKEADRLVHWAQSTIATTGQTEIAQPMIQFAKFQERMPSSDVEKWFINRHRSEKSAPQATMVASFT
jgi:hypothetical protein